MVLVLALVFAYSPVAVAKKKPKLSGTITNKEDFSKMKPGTTVPIAFRSLNVSKKSLKYRILNPDICIVKDGRVTADHPGNTEIVISSKKAAGKITLKVKVVAVEIKSVKFGSKTYYYDYDLDEPNDTEDPDTEDTEVDSSDPDEEDEEVEEDDSDLETLDIGEETEDGEGVYKLITTPFQITDKDLKKFEWTSSNPSVGTVNSEGQVTFYGQGTTTITATYKKNDKLTASIEITAGPSKVDPDDEESDPDDPEE